MLHQLSLFQELRLCSRSKRIVAHRWIIAVLVVHCSALPLSLSGEPSTKQTGREADSLTESHIAAAVIDGHRDRLSAAKHRGKPGMRGPEAVQASSQVEGRRAASSMALGLEGEERTRFPDYDSHHAPPPDARNLFQLSQDFPTSYNDAETFPWSAIDFKTHPELYLRTILAYCLEGNVEVDFRGQENPVRKWYHAPWLHDDGEPNGAGREYWHGLTRERRSRPLELHERQTEFAQNWAVGMVSDRGGNVLNRVWRTSSGLPDPTQATFPDNTVSFKLLFTDAPDSQVPYLAQSMTWRANVYRDTQYELPRVDRDMRLLQIDVAVKEPRVADDAGWIFGTFVYDGAAPFESVWDRMAFVGLSWSDDVAITSELNRDGAFENGQLSSTIVNRSLLDGSHIRPGQARMRHLGLGGRLNGPVDSPVSSCISCHGRAATALHGATGQAPSGKPREFVVTGARLPSEFPISQFARFFSPVRPNSQLVSDGGEQFVSTDYSLQVSAGIRNFYQNLRANGPANDASPIEAHSSIHDAEGGAGEQIPKVTRGDDN